MLKINLLPPYIYEGKTRKLWIGAWVVAIAAVVGGMLFWQSQLNAQAQDLAFVHERTRHTHQFLPVTLQVQRFELEIAFHPGAQGGQVEQSGHELDLVEHGFEEKNAELGQGLIRKVAAAIEIIQPALIGSIQAGIVSLPPTGQAARQAPNQIECE